MNEESPVQTQLNLDAITRVQAGSSNDNHVPKENVIALNLGDETGTPKARVGGLRYILWHLNGARRCQ